jgi:hypothetical protein
MGPTVRLRPRGSRALGASMVAVSAAGLLSLVLGGLDDVLQLGAPVVLFGVLGWACFWEPYVEVADGGVTVANTLRTVRVPWPAVEDVEGRYGLRLVTAYGPVTAWAAGAPRGRQRARQQHSAASAAVTQRLEVLRSAGYLDDRRLEGAALTTTWHRPLLVTVGVLGLAAVLLPFTA